MAAARRVVIPYAPRRVFLPFHERAQRFAIGVAHRRCGKTVACINDLVRRGMTLERQYPPGRLAYIGPQLNQSKDNVWQYLKHYTAPVARAKNESDLWVELVNGHRIRLYGADNPDRIRGAYLDDVVLDEYADMHPAVWGTIVRPMLADYRGRATFIGTPKGRNSFYELYERAKANPDWFSFFLPASGTGILPQDELDAAREDMTPEEYEQEFECSFDAAIKGAYYAREVADAEREGRIGEVPHEPALAVHTAWDLGVGDATAIWFFQVGGGEIRVIDHYETCGRGAQHFVGELQARAESLGYRYGDDFVPHDGKVREWTAGAVPRQRIEVLQSLGRHLRLVPAHKIEDGINAARVTFRRIRFDAARCKDGIEALRQYRAEYDDKARVFRNTAKHDWTSHTADAFRYLCMGWRERMADRPKPSPPKMLGVGDHNQVAFADVAPKGMKLDACTLPLEQAAGRLGIEPARLGRWCMDGAIPSHLFRADRRGGMTVSLDIIDFVDRGMRDGRLL